jgi:hypothetical protein
VENDEIAVKIVFSNTLVVRESSSPSYLAWDESESEFCRVSTYELVSCDIDPALKMLEYTLAPIPDSCFSPEVAEHLAKMPSRWSRSIDDPSVRVNDLTLEEMRSRGVKVKYVD